MIQFKSLLLIAIFTASSAIYAPNADNDEKYITLAVHDFIQKSPLVKKDSVFSIIVKEFGTEIVGVNIYGSTRKPVVVLNGNEISLSSLPSRFLEMNGKLFYWHDKEIAATPDVINVLKKFNFLDTAVLNVYIPPYSIDDAKKGEDYYFCRNNTNKFKTVRTNKAMGSSPLPKLNCTR